METESTLSGNLLLQGIEASIETAITEAVRNHAPLIIWRDGKVVEVSPEEFRNILTKTKPREQI
jgi:hypothetical protein